MPISNTGKNKKSKNKDSNNNKSNIKEKMLDVLELPKYVLLNIPKLTVLGSNNLIIENYKSILEYENDAIKINTSIGILKVLGSNLMIREIDSENVLIEGDIKLFEYL